MDTVRVTMELPRAALSALRKEPASFVADMRIAAAVKWYELEMISQAKAAEIAGLSRAEFIRVLDRFGVSPFQSSLDELIEESSNG
jgi:predicted HTH domain antitoxin